MSGLWWVAAAAILIGGGVLLFSRYFRLWLMAYASGARVGLLPLMLMSLRKVDPYVIVQCRVMTRQAGLPDVPTNALEAQYLAGGQVHRVILALIAAQRSGIDLDWSTAAAIDLAGRDILEAVQVSVNPKVIYCPDPAAGADAALHGVAQDGIQVRVRARVTVRTNLAQLIGGATEATVIARVGQGIVAAIGACTSYRQALADPQMISRQVISDGLDSQTAFAIVSIDIAEIAVGANIGARLQVDQAEADLRVARAAAEQRRAMAQATLQEMLALTREHQSTAVLAEVDLNHAVAAAFEAGHYRVRRGPSASGSPRDAAPLRAASSIADSRSRESPTIRRGYDAPSSPLGSHPR